MRIKNYLKTGILLLGILTITINCEKETIINNQIDASNSARTQIDYITAIDAPQVINAITSLTGKTSLKSTFNSKTLNYKKARIDIDNILKIKNHKNITNYTLNIFVQNAPLNEFYNLVINEDANKNVKNPYVIKYVVDDDALDLFLSNNSNFSYFKGKKYIISFNNFFDNYDTASKSYGDSCSTDGTLIDNTGNGGSGGVRDIPTDNHLQTDPNQYNYGESNAGDSYTIFFNSYNTTNQTGTSYTDPVRNEAFNISTTSSPGSIIEIFVPNYGVTNSSTPNVVKTKVSDPYYPVYDGAGGNGDNCKILITFVYSDNTTSTYEISCTQYQQKQAYGSKTSECPESEGEVGVLTMSASSKVITDCLGATNLDHPQTLFILKDSLSIDIGTYLKDNCNTDSEVFSFEMLHALMSGDSIIDNLSGKAKCTFNKLKTNSLIKSTLNGFVGKNTPVHLILNEQSNLTDTKTGKLLNGITYYGSSYYITISLNTEQANNRPSLSVVRTILHEAIHAYLYRLIKINKGFHINSLGQIVLADGAEANFPNLFNYYKKSDPQHEYIADFYRKAIETGLKEYAASIGQTYPDQLYKDLAWGGLQGTYAWYNMYADFKYTLSEQKRIELVLTNFNNSGNNECQ